MIKNIWINIPGFSKYEINRESRQIRSYCRGVEPRILKPCNNALILKADNGEKYTGSLKRFLYSAEKNIDPREISRKYCIVETTSGQIELIDRNTFQERIRERLRKRTSVSNIQEEYLNAIQFCAIVLQAYRTGDFSMVITEIESRKAKVTEYIIRHRIAVQPGTRTGSLGSRLRRSPKLHHREAHLHSKPYGLPEQHSTLLCSPKEEIRENNRKS